MTLSRAFVFVAYLLGSSNIRADEGIVYKSLGDWVCKANSYYSLKVDPLGIPKTERTQLDPDRVMISIKQGIDNSMPGNDPSYGDFGIRLHVSVSGRVADGTFDTLFDTATAQGNTTYEDHNALKFEEKIKSLLEIEGVYNYGACTGLFCPAKLGFIHLQKDASTWVFALTRQDITTNRKSKELNIFAGHVYEANVDVFFITGECLRL
jgi:hypothetical protein